MSRSRNAFLIRLVTAVTLLVSLLGPLVTAPQVAQAAGTGTLKIVKVTNPNPDPFDQSFNFRLSKPSTANQDFTLKNGESSSTFALNNDGNSNTNRTYTVTETAVAGWTTSISCQNVPSSWTVSTSGPLTLRPPTSNAGTPNITCTFTNTTTYAGKVTINKVTDPSPDATNQGFSFNAAKNGVAVSGSPFSLKNAESQSFVVDNSGSNATARTHVVTESPTAGWTLSNIACGAAPSGWTVTPDKANRKVTIVPPSGTTTFQNINCTFTNKQDGPPAEPSLSPLTVSQELPPGGSVDVTKLVTTPSGPPAKLDVLFLVDTTGSMQPSIDNVKTNAANIMNTVRAQVPDSQFAVAGYRDDYDTQSPPANYYFAVLQSMTSNITTAQAGINKLAARSNGQDVPEGWINALWQVASRNNSPDANLAVQFRTGSDVTRVVVLIGDSTGWDPSPRTSKTQGQGAQLTYWGGQHTEAQDIAALQAAGIKVMSLNVTNPANADGLDNTGQATRISNATGGKYLGTANYDAVADAIIDALTNLPVAVKLVVDTCDNPPLSVTFSPASKTVQPGESASFTETIKVADNTAPGTYTCKVKAQIDGNDLKDKNGNIIYETITINVTAGKIIVKKVTQPGGSTQSFSFTSNFAGNFNLKDGQSKDSGWIKAGTYNVSENTPLPAGWTMTSATCDDGSQPSSIALTSGKTVTCTFTNSQQGKIIVKKVTSPTSGESFTFQPSWGANFTLTNGQSNDSGPLTAGVYSVSEVGKDGWSNTGATCDGTGNTPDKINLGGGQTVTCTFTNTKLNNLTVEKTATGTFDRAYQWKIAKSIDESSSTVTIGPGGSATFNYNVQVDQTGFTDSNWKIAGKITVKNPNGIAITGVTVTDSFEGTTCTVTGGTGVTVPANGQVVLDYTCALSTQPAYTGKNNVATATWNKIFNLPSTSATGQVGVTFNPDKKTNATVTVKDNKVNQGSVTLGTLNATDGPTWAKGLYEYPLTFQGVNGTCTDYKNSAWLDGTDWQAGKTVTVCVDSGATVTKSVSPSFTKTYGWSITKDVDKTSINIAPGGDASFGYTVKVTNDGGTNSAWKVTGTIDVTNNNQYAAMTGVVVTDDILNDTKDSCVVAPGATTIAAGATEHYTYTCTWSGAPAATSQTNRATVTWATGKSATYDKIVAWSDSTVTEVDKSVTVSDSQAGDLGTATAGVGENPTVYKYDLSHAGVTGACTDYNNTATYTATDSSTVTGSANKKVTVCVGADLTASKTASGSYDRTYLWKIEKTATNDRIENATGSAEFEYKVTVTQTGVTDAGYSVKGQITINNPNTWQTVTVNVSDAIGAGWSCTITGGGTGIVVPKATDSTHPGTKVLDYTCTWTGTGSPTTTGLVNTATISWDKAAANTTNSSVTATASITFGGSGAKNKTINVTDPLAPSGTFTAVTATDPPASPASTTFTYKHTFTGDPAGCTTHDNTATITETEQSATETVTHCVGADLTVSKSASGSFDREYLWSISKTSNKDSQNVPAGTNATFDYSVTATQTGIKDSNWKVTGKISVHNPNWQTVTVASVTDSIGAGWSCTVTGGTNVAVGAGQTVMLDYTCAWTGTGSPSYEGKNTATATWDKAKYSTPTGTASGDATFGMSQSGSKNKTVDVYDNKVNQNPAVKLGSVTGTDAATWASQTFTYSLGLAGVSGVCTDYTNTATLKVGESTLGTASKKVTVCGIASLGITKTANPALTRTYAWGIQKSSDVSSQTIPLGGTATFNYTVSVTHDTGTDSLWKVSGTITVTNPNDQAVTGVSVSDKILSEPNASCTVTGGSSTIAANGSTTFNYTCAYTAAPAASAQTNQATVTWTSLGAGTTSASVDLPFNWTNPGVTRVNDEVDVTDTQVTGSLGTVKYTDASPKEFKYEKKFTPETAGCSTYDNTATYTAKDNSKVTGSANKSVQVCTGVDLTVSKTANPAYHRTVTWAIDKNVDASSVTIAAGGTVTSNYTVDVTKTVVQSAWVVTGTITVTNPNGWAIAATIGDAIDHSGVCSITSTGGGSVTVPAASNGVSGTKSVDYECTFTSNPGSGTNTATATWNKDTAHTPTGTASGTKGYDFANASTTTTGQDTITASDPLASPTTKTFSASGQWKYSVNRAGVAGACTTYDNTATIIETKQSDSASVQICVGVDLTVSKTVVESFDRTYKWKVDKSVDGAASQTISSGSATFNYIVDVTADGYTDSNWKITGAITVTNPNSWAITGVVTDIYDGVSCAIQDNGAVTVPAATQSGPGTKTLTYTCTFTTKPAYSGTNTAKAQWNSETYHTPTGEATGTKPVSFDTPTHETNRTVDVYDSAKTEKLGTSDYISGPFQYKYSLAWEGTPGQCTTHDNTATLKSGETTVGSDKQTVTVCTVEPLGITKTANPALTRTYAWGIQKSSDVSSQTIPLGDTATFNYTVSVTHDTGTDSLWKVSGTITVTNPNDQAVTGVSVSDKILSEPNASCTVTGGSSTIAANGSTTFNYTCAYTAAPAASAQTNQATVTWTSLGAGTTSASVDLPFNWTNPGVTHVNDEVDVTDTQVTGSLGTVKYTDASPKEFKYEKKFTPETAGCSTYDNTATYTAKDNSKVTGSANKSVQVCTGVDLTVSKTANPAYHRTVTWAIDKNVDASSVTIAAGGTVTSNYTVDVTKTVVQSAWVVTGTITVSNPNGWAVAATIGDAIDHSGVCSITSAGGGSVTVPAASNGVSGTKSVDYECTFTSNPGSGTNTATATWNKDTAHTPTGTASGTKGYDFANASTTTTGQDTITASDPLASPTTKTFSASGQWKYSVNRAGVAGACTTYGNTATITETKQTDSASVQICVGADLTVSKSASGSFDREYLWNVTKTSTKDSQNVPAGTNATFDYSVTATQTGIKDSNWKVTGTISVHNPNWQSVTVASVTDSIGAGWSCTVTGGTNVAVGAGQTVMLDYTCEWTGNDAPSYEGKNTATATWDAAAAHTPTGTASGDATFGMSQSGSKNKTVDVYDNKVNQNPAVKLGSVTGTDAATWASQTFTYSLGLAGVSGVCTNYTNTATLKVGETTVDSAGKTVTVCGAADLTVSKTANTAFVRTYSWTIDKSVDPTSVGQFAGDSTDLNYTVGVKKNTVDSAWVVSGQITVTNSNQFQAVTVTVTDAVNNGGVCSVPGGTNVTVPAATSAGPGTKTLAYTCTYASAPNPSSGMNTATATWDKELAHTPTGSASGTAAADFGKATITENGDKSVNVTDSNGETWGPVSDSTTWKYKDAAVCSNDPAAYKDGHYSATLKNTATIDQTGTSANTSVTVDCYAPVVSGQGTADYTRTWNWNITKTADQTTMTLPFWQPGTINYTVNVTATPNDSDLTVNGTLTIKNPNPNAPMTATIAGNVNGVAATFSPTASCTISGGQVTIPAGGTATCNYTAALGSSFPPAGGSATAAATVTVGGVAFGASTTVAIGDPSTITDETINVTDTLAGSLGTVSAAGASSAGNSKTWKYPITVGPFPSNTNKVIDNTATYTTTDTGKTGDAKWSVTVKVIRQAVCDCTQNSSYWVNMADKGGRRGYDATWDLVGPRGADTTFFKSPYSFRMVLMLVPRGNDAAYYNLAQQYVVADLNLLHGASAPQEVVDAMYGAKAIFDTYTPAQVAAMNSTQKAQLASWTNTLSRFNTGAIGPGRCR